MDTVVFLGPTLPRAEAELILPASYEPPARMGDVYRVLRPGLARIVIIDGVFHGVPSVWHREILDAMAEGVEVCGASSMGALRAAELNRFGMIGHGQVFEWYRDGVIDADDEVALRHGDEASGFRPMSEPLVNIRATLTRAAANGSLDPALAEGLIEWQRAIHYPDRSLRSVLDCPAVQRLPADLRTRLGELVARERVDIKQIDARSLLTWCRDTAPSSAADLAAQDEARPERVLWRIAKILRATRSGPAGSLTGAALLERTAAEDPERVAQLRHDLARCAFVPSVDEWAHAHGVDEDPAWIEERGPEHFGIAFHSDSAVAAALVEGDGCLRP
jgi:hypothetical protein